MGQYYKLVNTDKQVVVARDMRGTDKFFEWLYNNQARDLVWLLRQSSEGGGGDIPDPHRYATLGRWAGDRISLVGDYDESDLYVQSEGYQNISASLLAEYNRAVEEDGFRAEYPPVQHHGGRCPSSMREDGGGMGYAAPLLREAKVQ